MKDKKIRTLKTGATGIVILFGVFLMVFYSLCCSFASTLKMDMSKLLISKQEADKIGLRLTYNQAINESADPYNPPNCYQNFFCKIDDKYLNSETGFTGAEIKVAIHYLGMEEKAKKWLSEMINSVKKNHKDMVDDAYFYGKLSQRKIYKYIFSETGNRFLFKEIFKRQYYDNGKLSCTDNYLTVHLRIIKGPFEIYLKGLFESATTGSCKWAGAHTYCNTQEKFDKLIAIYSEKIDKLLGKEKPSVASSVTTEEDNITQLILSAYKEQYEESVEKIDINKQKTKRLIVSGTIYDKDEKEIPFAKVELKVLGKRFNTICDRNGNYLFDIILNPSASNTVKKREYFYLTKKAEPVKVKLLSDDFVANGKRQLIKLQISDKNGPVRNRNFYINFSKEPVKLRGNKVNYILKPVLGIESSTNDRGILKCNIKAPCVDKHKLNKISNPDLFFPVSVKLNIYSQEEGPRTKVGEVIVRCKSPFPKIKRFLVPGNLDAGIWQKTPSTVYIEDLDSKIFNIAIKGKGRFKTKGSKIYTDGYRSYNFSGNVFRFYFASNQLGLDLNKQPDLWIELLDTNIKNALNFSLAILEGWGLEAASKMTKYNKLLTKKLSSGTATSIGKLGTGGLDYYASTLNLFKVANKKDIDAVTFGDWELGGFSLGYDAYALVKKINFTFGATMQLEAAKAIYENAKTIYNVYKKYQKINNAYQDVVFIPIYLSVSDSDGYETISLKTCSVRIWKGD